MPEDLTLPPGYLSKAFALEAAGVSDSTLDRMVADGRVRSTLARIPGRKSERVYREDDCQRQKEERERREALRPPSALAPKEPKQLAVVPNQLQRLAEMFRQPQQPTVTRWLTLEEAAERKGFSLAYILKLCRKRQIKALKAGAGTGNTRWRIDPKSLEEWNEWIA